MNFCIVDIKSKDNNSIIENFMDENVLKELAFQRKIKTPTLEYKNVLIPIKREFNNNDDSKNENLIFLNNSLNNFPESAIYSIKETLNEVSKLTTIFINLLEIVTDEDFNIFYTDGSFSSKNSNIAGFACCKLLKEDNINSETLLDDWSEKNYLFESYSGKIENATNNIGELTGIKTAVENFGSKKYQIIISDSIYGIKTYREYIHVWKENGYKTYAKKPIKNKELILETYNKIKEAQNTKIIFFKWTKGHAGASFNEKCDELAKSEIGM